MARKRKKKQKREPHLHEETMLTIWALLCIALGLLFVLAGFGIAGSAGNVIYKAFFGLLGWGYVLLPIMLLAIAINFLLQKERTHMYGPTIWGSLLFLAGSLGLIEILFDSAGGIVGSLTAYPQHWFGALAWGIITPILAIIGIVIGLDRPLRLFAKKEKKEDTTKEEREPIPLPDMEEDEEKEEIDNNKERKEEPKKESATKLFTPKKGKALVTNADANYTPPPLDLLRSTSEKPNAGDLRANANIIRRTLEGFGIPVEMGEINIGPKVTRYTLRPAEGVKLSRITALNQDLAMALASHPIRIEAPIPGKPYVGIEVPNKTAAIVRLGNLLSYPDFAQSGLLSFPVGRDVTGEPLFSNVEKMPHMLIAGATGSGKSITLHSLLISLLYKNSPATLKMVLIDPKRVELSAYNNLPHLIAPVITQGKKSLAVFRWAISEMENRYETFLQAGARDIQSYNKKNGNSMPFIIIVVDEMADLMASYGRDIENAIVRLAQMARATGIHLILSTQRPSVEVITGLIKANITARIALQVASQIDSRTILDTAGAEKLLGGGDLLFTSAEFSKPRRVQGAFVSEEEIQRVTNFIKENNAEYQTQDDDVEFEDRDDNVERGATDVFEAFVNAEEDDDLLPDAVEIVTRAQKASASMLQRRLKVGYARAARLLDIMEEKGIVGPADGAKPREVYVTPDIQNPQDINKQDTTEDTEDNL
jgi:S-DNA-T family DNA segregation ATPase FtsK/SpoIIIE